MPRLLVYVLLSLLPLCAVCATAGDSLSVAVMQSLYRGNEVAAMEHVKAELYLKQRVEVKRKNLLVNFFPNMTRFDRDECSYLSEYVYDVEYFYRMLPKVRRVAGISSFGHGSGEMEAVLEFMTPQLYGERLFSEEYLSPLSAANSEYYTYLVDTAYCRTDRIRIIVRPKFDNIQLFSAASLVVGAKDMLLYEATMQGRNEQFSFSVSFVMAGGALTNFLVDSVSLSVDYSFAWNELEIKADGVYRYYRAALHEDRTRKRRNYDVGVASRVLPADRNTAFPDSCRRIPLSRSDSLFYESKGVLGHAKVQGETTMSDDGNYVKNLLWRVGDGAISSHTLAWGDSDLKISPLINPSYLSYSSSKGLSYKIALNMRTSFSPKCRLEVKPVIGYNFKYSELYWNVRGNLFFAPMKRAAITADIGRGSSLYSSEVLDYIKGSSYDSLRFDKLPIVYYRDFHVKAGLRFEPCNGLELQMGANMYRRSLYNSVVPPGYEGLEFERYYKRFAPNVRVTWHPGMYYCVVDGKKVNLGSRAPRFALDVEQGVSGVFGSRGRYTRAEFDVQYKRSLSSLSSLYLRAAAGGYFHADDIYFVDYVFLKNNLLPLDKDDETSGEFQLLDREWYNSADRYLSLNAGYASPFLFLQRVVPSARFIKNESLYLNLLFMSHLCPYWECGYGVETPYVDMGLFAGFERGSFLKIGYKLSFSLFKE